jgi:multidrug efflux pump subunit AcrB
MKENHNIIQWAMRNKQIIITIICTLILFGVYALLKMPRQEFPEFTIRQGLIIGIYPGASSEKVEDQLTREVENYLFGFKEVRREKTYSISKESVMIIFVELNDDVKKSESDTFWAKLRLGLTELKGQLPGDVLSLTASNDFSDTSAIILSMESSTKTYKELETYLKELESQIRKIPSVSKVNHYGLQKEEIGIYIDDAKLSSYAIKPITLLAAFGTEGTVNYAGELDNGKRIMPIHIPSRYASEIDVAEQIIYSDPRGDIVRLKDVARVVREYKDPDSYIRVNGKKSIIISLEMQRGNNIVAFGKEVDNVVKDFTKNIPSDISLNKIADMPRVVDNSITEFLIEFVIAIFAVILVTMLLLPFRISSIAAITIPVTVLIAFGIIHMFNIELDTVTLAALIVSLGMVVDNAIVVIDHYVEKLDHGDSPWDAAWRSPTELFIPVLTATLAILAAFTPFAIFLTGMANDMVKAFPVVIGVTLGMSLLIAVFLVPIMTYSLVKSGLKKDNISKRTLLDITQAFYDRTLEKAFEWKKVTILIGILSIVAGIAIAAFVPRELFPKVDRNQFAVEIYLPTGTALEETESMVKDLESILAKDKRVKTVASFIGTSSPRFHTVYAPNFPAKSYAQLIVTTESNDVTEKILDEYSEKYSNYYSKAYIRWKQLALNPTPFPIEIRISGDDIASIKKTAAEVSAIMNKTKNVAWVKNDFEQPLESIYVDVDKDKSNRFGISQKMLSYSLMVGFKGFAISKAWEGDYPVDIVLHIDKRKKANYSDISNLYVTTPMLLSTIPLRQIADIKPEWTEGQIIRRNGIRTITVKADVERNVYASDVLAKIRPSIAKLQLPVGVSIGYGGEAEAEVENYVSLSYALITSVVLIFFILLFQFKRVKKALIILSTMLLSILGAVIGLLVCNFPFGFTAFLGVISLFGIVVRNGIILVDYADGLSSQHISPEEAGLAAGKRRMRPIFLTASAAAVGVVPMIVTRAPMWGPMATVICFGMIFSMIFTLYVLPVLYTYLNNERGLD